MPDLLQSIQKHDLGYLHIVAGGWGLELTARQAASAAAELAALLLDPDLLRETLEILPPEARAALDALKARGGRMSWAEFARQYGDIREMGPGKRDREEPYFKSASPAEALYYRALLARSFFDTPNGPLEFAYVPEDLLDLLHRVALSGVPEVERESDRTPVAAGQGNPELLGRPASPVEKAFVLPASATLLEDATTFLAALRIGIAPPETCVPMPALEGFLRAAKIILKSGPKPEAVKTFLEASRPAALAILSEAWLKSESFNELRLLPGLACEGEWANQPLVTREFLLNLLGAVPQGRWWSLVAFVRDVKSRYPDFQRPAGDYDSWFIKRQADGTYLRGFAYWDQVDGALIRYLVAGPLFWLGKVELAAPGEGQEPTAFRFVRAIPGEEPKGKITVASNGRMMVERAVSRAVRYQVARFCEWEEPKAGAYQYRLSPSSLARALQQGLKVEQLLSLLAKHAAGGLPPVLVQALKRWEANGVEARLQRQVVLRVSRPEVLEEMRRSRAARFLGEALGPTTVVVKEGAQFKVLAALAELGLLAEEEK